MQHYLDNSATTRVSESAAEKVIQIMTENWGNPGSLHTLGIRAEEELESSRKTIASVLGADSSEIYFTSGGTEANNLAVLGSAQWLRRRGNRIITTAIEHSSVFEAMKRLESDGFEVIFLKPQNNGEYAPEQFEEVINKNTILVSAMLVNNELGTILPVEKLRRMIDKSGAPAVLHTDCVQAFCKIPVKVKKLGADIVTVSGHKIHGPKGVGAIYVKKGLHPKPQHLGGEQEKKLRPGTEPLPLIAGMAQAVRDVNIAQDYARVSALHDHALGKLLSIKGISLNSPDSALPYIINISVGTIRSETLLHFLAAKNIYVSSGSACAKGKPSHVLSAAGLSRERADSAIRVSFAAENTGADVDALCEALQEALNTLVKR